MADTFTIQHAPSGAIFVMDGPLIVASLDASPWAEPMARLFAASPRLRDAARTAVNLLKLGAPASAISVLELALTDLDR